MHGKITKCDSKTQTSLIIWVIKITVIKFKEDAKSWNFHLIIILSRFHFLYKIRGKIIYKHSIIDGNIWQIITENAENYV